jgi:hypothetical protein
MTSVGVSTGLAPGGIAALNKDQPLLPPAGGDTSPVTNAAAIAAAQQALVNANSEVDTDKLDHSPACVAVDERHVEQAEIALAQAKSAAGVSLDLTV